MIRLSEPAYRFIDIHMPGFLKDYLVHYTSGAMTVKHQGTWHKLIRSMLVSVTLYLVVCVFFITLYFSYVHPLIRKSLPGMEGNLLGFIIIFLVISPFLWAIIMKRTIQPSSVNSGRTTSSTEGLWYQSYLSKY